VLPVLVPPLLPPQARATKAVPAISEKDLNLPIRVIRFPL
jgi:hypothetical protein